MELVYVTVIGAAIGTLLRYVLPGRSTYGIALLPALGAATTAAVWVGLVWLGFTFDGGWIWAISLGAAALVCALTATLLHRTRTASDAQRLHVLAGGKP